MESPLYQIGIVGTGYWGPKLVKSFELTEKVSIRWHCDIDLLRLKRVSSKYNQANTTSDIEEVLDDDEVCAVVIATPTWTHYVLVEKPLTANSAQALDLIKLSREKNKILMVGHVFEYNSSIQALRKVMDSGELGEIQYLNFERTNHGPVRTDVNVFPGRKRHC